MSLADDIRTGAAMSDPARGYYTHDARPDSRHQFSACALGCAAIARGIGWEREDVIIEDLECWYPELNMWVEHPVWPGHQLRTLWSVIMSLNDTHEWTREAIASWIDSLTLDLTPVVVREEVSV